MMDDKSKARRYELTSNLLNIMYNELDKLSESKRRKIILSRQHQFDALLLIDVMIQKGHVESKTNTEVYDMYAHCSEGLGLKTMSKYELSKFLCKYFDFMTIPQRFGDKIERVFFKLKQPKTKAEPYSVIGTEEWEAASAEEKMQVIKSASSGAITASYEDYILMLKYMVEQAEK